MDNSKYRFKVYKQCFHDSWYIGSSIGTRGAVLLRKDLSLEKDESVDFILGYTKFDTEKEAQQVLDDYLNCNNLAE